MDFTLTGTNLFIEITYEHYQAECLAASPNVNDSNIVGSIAHYIETDLENERIGWTSRDCSLPL